jgi:peroxiredoxin Q/BCP
LVLRGLYLVLFFYSMVDTPGCTAQACSLRDVNRDIAAKGAAILGVSSQDEASHRRFTQKHGLNVPLLADEGGAVGRAYGTIGGRAVAALGALRHVRPRDIIDEGDASHVIDSRRGQPRREVLLLWPRPRTRAAATPEHGVGTASSSIAVPHAGRRRSRPIEAARVLRRHGLSWTVYIALGPGPPAVR